MINSSNPTIRGLNKYVDQNVESATYGGVSWKALYFVAVTILSAVLGWRLLLTHPTLTVTLLVVSMVVALVCALVSAFVPKTTPVTGSLYALAEGFMVGAISALFSAQWSGIVLGAFLSTMVVFAVMMILYTTGVIRVGAKFQKFIISALVGLLATQFLILIFGLIFPSVWQVFYGGGPVAIIVSAVMVIIASLCLLSDLGNITMIVQNGLPKRYEWNAAFGLTVSLIWLYVEFLRLFALIAASRN